MSEATFTFRNGREVRLCRLNQTVLQSILYDVAAAVERTDDVKQADEDADAKGMRLFKYCAGWGIADAPGDDDLKVLAEMGFDRANEHLTRIGWVQFCLLSGANGTGLDDAPALMSAVLMYTYTGKDNAND